eukprot:9618877-Alexandrium_andersonii.AAC.1
MQSASPMTRALRSVRGAWRRRRRAREAPAASASRAPVPSGRVRTSRATSRNCAWPSRSQRTAAAPAGSSAEEAPEPSKVTIRPEEKAGVDVTAGDGLGRSCSPARTTWVATSSPTQLPHRHRRVRQRALALGTRTALGCGHQCSDGPGQPAVGHDPCSVARRSPLWAVSEAAAIQRTRKSGDADPLSRRTAGRTRAESQSADHPNRSQVLGSGEAPPGRPLW